MKFILALLCLAYTSTLLAAWPEDFQALKQAPRKYQVAGTICEEFARLGVEKNFSKPQYEVLTGIAYADNDGTVGELDVVVFDHNLHRVVEISEVKCWGDLRAALRKAQEQSARFQKSIHSGQKLVFKSTITGREFAPEEFELITGFRTIAQKGGVAAGFDQELNYTLAETIEHSSEMLQCQAKKICARP